MQLAAMQRRCLSLYVAVLMLVWLFFAPHSVVAGSLIAIPSALGKYTRLK
jgi:hypothetical protein